MILSALTGALVFNVLYMNDMTASSNIPDGISFSDLEGLADQAALREEEATKTVKEAEGPLFDGKTESEVEEIASAALKEALEKCDDPIVHKIIVLRALENMMDWHTLVGEKQFDDDENCSGICWLRDAGKFQACMNILINIQIGPHDFTMK